MFTAKDVRTGNYTPYFPIIRLPVTPRNDSSHPPGNRFTFRPEIALMKIYEDITFQDAKSSSFKRENANINGDTSMGSMLQMGSAGAREYFLEYVLKK